MGTVIPKIMFSDMILGLGNKFGKACPLVDICNSSDGCLDDDWKHCGVYINFVKLIKSIKS